jgi:hypothetical protein
MTISLAQNSSPKNIPHFKKRPLAQLITLTLSLAGYGMISNSAHAQASPVCGGGGSDVIIVSSETNTTPCTIAVDHSVSINDSAVSLNNESTLYNSGTLNNNSGTLGNSGTLNNYGLLHNESDSGVTSNLTNSGTLTNSGIRIFDNNDELVSDGGLINYSQGAGSISTLTNSDILNNEGDLYNESYAGGTSSLINEAGGEITNTSYLLNVSDGYDSKSTLTNYGTLNNEYGLQNLSSYGGTSTLTNKVGAILTNKEYATIVNVSGYDYSGIVESSTSTLTNEGTLINNGHISNNDMYGISTLDNAGTLTNNFMIDNYGTITNSGIFEISETGSLKNYGSFIQTEGSTIVNGKNLVFGSTGDFFGGIYGSGTLEIMGGSLSGSSTIEAESITIGEDATVKPGNSPGTLIMMSDLELLGTLQTEIVSSIMGDYDVLEVQGNVTFSDTSAFDFLFDDSYIAVDGDSFDFLSAFTFDFGLAIDFADWFDMSHFTVTGLDAAFGWSVSYTDNFDPQAQTPSYLSLNILADDSVADPNAVSAPATLGLFGLALTLIGWGGRRRTKLRSQTA